MIEFKISFFIYYLASKFNKNISAMKDIKYFYKSSNLKI